MLKENLSWAQLFSTAVVSVIFFSPNTLKKKIILHMLLTVVSEWMNDSVCASAECKV